MKVPTFVCLFRDDSTTTKGPGCDEGTNLRLGDFAVVLLMPTRAIEVWKKERKLQNQLNILDELLLSPSGLDNSTRPLAMASGNSH